MFQGRTPDKGTKQWVKNEKTINENPVLKKARDHTEGFNTSKKNYGSSPGGKGSTQRPTNHQAYADNWDRIFGKKD
jgi:hypothetical protein